MNPMTLKNPSRTLAKEQDEYLNLDIHDQQVNGVNGMTSVWKPSAEEIKELQEGGYVRLTILGWQHPPVLLTTQPKQEISL